MQKSKLKEQVKRVIEYSQDLSDLNVDELIDVWSIAKREYIYAFGENLIYEYPEKVSFELSQAEKEDKLETFAESIANKYDNYKLRDFVLDNMHCFFSNSLSSNYSSYNSFTGEPIEIQAGTKIVKAFKYFESNKEILEILQNKASNLIQEDKISGTLCLSVHPLDYLSLSESTHNWRSCHSLDGEYRSGNLSYMVDDCTIICYLKSDKAAVLPRFPQDIPWNNKKWRVLLFVPPNKSMLFLGRQYPFTADQAANFITEKLLPSSRLFPSYTTWTKWTSNVVKNVTIDNTTHFLSQGYIPVGGKLKTYQDLIVPGKNALNFNDLLRSSCYTPMYCYMKEDKLHRPFSHYDEYGDPYTKFIVGGEVSCLKCGQKPITNSSTVLCNDCEEQYGHLEDDSFTHCSECGRHMNSEHGTWISDQFVCPECAERLRDEYEECDHCGSYVWKNLMFYDEETDEHLCHFCHTFR